MKKILSVLLIISLVIGMFSYLSITSSAVEEEQAPECEVVYSPNKFNIEYKIGDGEYNSIFDRMRFEYSSDTEEKAVLSITPTGDNKLKGIIEYYNDGTVRYFTDSKLVNGKEFTIDDIEIYRIQIVADGELFNQEYTITYDQKSGYQMRNSGINIDNGSIKYLSGGSTAELTEANNVRPYKIIMTEGLDKKVDVTNLYTYPTFKYKYENTLYRDFHFYFTKQEYDFDSFADVSGPHILAECVTYGGGDVGITYENGEKIPDENILKFGNRTRVLLPKKDTCLKVMLLPAKNQNVDSVRLDGKDEEPASYGNGVFYWNIGERCGYTHLEANFTNSSGENYGTDGENVWWYYDAANKVLNVNGNGAISDYSWLSNNSGPWKNCSNLCERIVIANGISKIGEAAFANFVKVKDVVLPSSVQIISKFAFNNCQALQNINIPEGVRVLSQQSFQNCISVKEVNLPSTVDRIISTAIHECTSLEKITVAEDNATYKSIDNCLIDKLNGTIILGCKTSIIPTDKDITTIGVYAFYNCKDLKTITIPQNISSIENLAFTYSGLTTVTIPSSITKIGVNVFRCCTSLKTVYLPNSVKTISELAFGESGLKNVCYCGTQEEWKEISIGDNNLPLVRADISYHNYQWSKDQSLHSLICSICGNEIDKESHTYDNACDTTCNDCEYVRITDPHVYDNACDKTCNICGNTRVVGAHVYDNDCDSLCNICEKERTITHKYNEFWTSDGISHWHECSVCKAKTHVENHVANNETCKICGQLLAKKLPLIHPAKSFPDVSKSLWCYDAVNFATQTGLFSGFGDGTFGPAKSIMRHDFIVVLARYAGVDLSKYQKVKTTFKDVPLGTYYSAAIAWGLENGILTGFSPTKFGVGYSVTREQFVTFLYRYAEKFGYDTTPTMTEGAIKAKYPDYNKVSPFAQKAMIWAISRGIISGKDGKYIAPQVVCQRCEAAQIFYNIDSKGILIKKH